MSRTPITAPTIMPKEIKLLTKWEMPIEAALALLNTQAYQHTKALVLHSHGLGLNDPGTTALAKADPISVRSIRTCFRGN